MTESDAFVFGPFRLSVARRELLAHGVPVLLGQRAFDVLLALVSRHGQLVTKDDLMAEVWPGVVVDENNIQVHISALRKILGDERGERRFLLTVAGRGYRFVHPVERSSAAPVHPRLVERDATAAAGVRAPGNLPHQITTLIGREEAIEIVGKRLQDYRLVTLVGPGGVGRRGLRLNAPPPACKTTPMAHGLLSLLRSAIRRAWRLAIAEPLGVALSSDVPAIEVLSAALRSRHMLLVIDNCEHLIAEVARIAEVLIKYCPRVRILASSRERLTVAGENVFRVPSLATPDGTATLSAARAQDYAAIRLFADRAKSAGNDFVLTDDNATIVGAICRRLDGIPLAIELAVPRLEILSLSELARGLEQRFGLLKGGSRTALPRHQTLQALIGWSYDLLTADEKDVLCRLGIFAGSAIPASIAAVAGDTGAAGRDPDALSSLVDKSLVMADRASGEARYRLLESVRYFALDRLTAVQVSQLRRRHAAHFAARCAQATAEWETTPTEQLMAAYAADADNLRAALQWAFGNEGDCDLALELVSYSHVIWAELGLIVEHRYWVEKALRRIVPSTPAMIVARLLSWQAGDVKEIDDPTDYDDAMRAAGLYESLGDRFHQGQMLLRAGIARVGPDGVADEGLLSQAHALLRPFGHTKTLARCLGALASARLSAADVAAAQSLHRQAVDVYRQIGDVPLPAPA